MAAGQTVATEREEWTEPCPEVYLSFLFFPFLSLSQQAGFVPQVPRASVQVVEEEEGAKSGECWGCYGKSLPT